MRRSTVAVVAMLAVLAVAMPAEAVPPSELIRTKASLRCLEGGGARASLWVRNIADRSVMIAPDIHFKLTLIRGEEQEPGPVVFMTPVPDLADLDPREASRFVVPIGEALEDEPPTDLSADRLRLRVEVYLEGRDHAAVSRFRFPGCPPPVSPPYAGRLQPRDRAEAATEGAVLLHDDDDVVAGVAARCRCPARQNRGVSR